jgi:hypothetical protein
MPPVTDYRCSDSAKECMSTSRSEFTEFSNESIWFFCRVIARPSISPQIFFTNCSALRIRSAATKASAAFRTWPGRPAVMRVLTLHAVNLASSNAWRNSVKASADGSGSTLRRFSSSLNSDASCLIVRFRPSVGSVMARHHATF